MDGDRVKGGGGRGTVDKGVRAKRTCEGERVQPSLCPWPSGALCVCVFKVSPPHLLLGGGRARVA